VVFELANRKSAKVTYTAADGQRGSFMIANGARMGVDFVPKYAGGPIREMVLTDSKKRQYRVGQEPGIANFAGCLGVAQTRVCFKTQDLNGVDDSDKALEIAGLSPGRYVGYGYHVEWDEGQAPIAAYKEEKNLLYSIENFVVKLNDEQILSEVSEKLSASAPQAKKIRLAAEIDPNDP
jgi:hypothetical protein